MTDEQLDAIEERAKAAVSGPWETIGDIYVYAPIGMVADVPIYEDVEFMFRMRGVGRGATIEEQTRNLEFIAHARQDVPDLVAEVRRLKAELAATCSCQKAASDHYPKCPKAKESDAVAQSLRSCRYQSDRHDRVLAGSPCGKCAPCVAKKNLGVRDE